MSRAEPVTSLPPDPHPAALTFAMPQAACDCHMHVFGPFDDYPMTHTNDFVPACASFDMYVAMAAQLGLSRAVVVQSAVYGADHACMRDALVRAAGRWRGIALLSDRLSEQELPALIRAGVTGMRVNLLDGSRALDGLLDWAQRLRSLSWHVELLLDLDILHAQHRTLTRTGLPLVIDHMGYTRAERALTHPGLDVMKAMLREGAAWAKLSGIDRIGHRAHAYDDARRLCAELIEARPDRLVWGSDWPHVSRRVMPNDGDLLNRCAAWLNDAALLERILVENPRTLYRF